MPFTYTPSDPSRLSGYELFQLQRYGSILPASTGFGTDSTGVKDWEERQQTIELIENESI